MPPWRRRSRQTVSLPPCSTLLSVACPALRSGISFPYNRSGSALSVKRRPSLLDGILLPRVHRSAAPPIPILLPNRQHTRVLGTPQKIEITWLLFSTPCVQNWLRPELLFRLGRDTSQPCLPPAQDGPW